MFSTVVLPQPEWPITQPNSPRAIDSQRFSNTAIVAAVGAGITPRDAFDGDELVGHRAHSGNVTMRVNRARIWSSSMPTIPIRRMAMMTLVIERLFHSFQTK